MEETYNKKTNRLFLAGIYISIIAILMALVINVFPNSIKFLKISPTIVPITYHVVGKQIADNEGNNFIPYGVQLDGILMAQSSWQSNMTYLTFDQVKAAHDFWHSNTVSLQLGSKALFAKTPYDADYIAAIDQTVSWANHLGMNILLVLQYQGAGNSGQQMPTQDSVAFWNILSKHYANNPHVFFDLFNEPTLDNLVVSGSYDDNNAAWSFWQHGGLGADRKTYVGMQDLIDTIRHNRFNNIIFVDGLAAAEDIALLPKHTLNGKNIVYAIHPYLDSTQHHTQSDWDGWFGNVATNSNFPVVADEWSQYQDQHSFSIGDCLTDAPTVVPQLLTYLRNRNIGLIGFALFPGTLIRGWNFRDPTTFDNTITNCPLRPFPDYSSAAQGAGKLLVHYFTTYSYQYSQSSLASHLP